MGVFGTFCQVCAMPLQHNCYAPAPSDSPLYPPGTFLIHRGPSCPVSSALLPLSFGVEHAWLRETVALELESSGPGSVVKRGNNVQDGDLEVDGETITVPSLFGGEPTSRPATVSLKTGLGDRCGIHQRCWEIGGRASFAQIEAVAKSDAWRELERKFHGQLFDFDKLVAEGLAWMCEDPDTNSEDGRQNRARIESLLSIVQAADAGNAVGELEQQPNGDEQPEKKRKLRRSARVAAQRQ